MRDNIKVIFHKDARVQAALFLILVFLVSGCGYSIQKKADLPFNEIFIGKLNNNTFEPKLQDKLHRALAESFSLYGFQISPSSRYRLEGDITKFEIKTLSEKDLITTEYQILLFCTFRLIDADTGTITKIDSIAEPFVNYFVAKGRLENVLAQKEVATEISLRELSKELARYIIYMKANIK